MEPGLATSPPAEAIREHSVNRGGGPWEDLQLAAMLLFTSITVETATEEGEDE